MLSLLQQIEHTGRILPLRALAGRLDDLQVDLILDRINIVRTRMAQ